MTQEEASIAIDTSITAAYVTLVLRSERVDAPLVEFHSNSTGSWRRLEPEEVVQIVLRATDEANARFRSTRHPHLIRYCVEDNDDKCPTLARAAYAIVAGLAVKDLAIKLQAVLAHEHQTLHQLSRESGFPKRVLNDVKNKGTLDELKLYQQIEILEYFGVIDTA